MPAEKTRPNVIIVLTDDQGYPDLGCHGNPYIQTPNIDAFHADAVRLADFHVQPLCTPTRGALMTGRRPVRNGAWATCWGRSILRADETTMADVFRAGGYRTGLFGKWHLGDNTPFRPFERGFERTVAHQGGGVGQVPDFWGNNYFDDTYFHNGQARAHTGYCTDVWFEQAMRFIDDCGADPFFAVVATNAPHSPYLVAEKYQALYANHPEITEPAFYGMITNIDENFGQLRTFLAEKGLENDTLLVFMTDNGSSGSARLDEKGFETKGYNAGLRGMKGSYYDGGHKVPFFLRWPGAGLTGGQDRNEMTLDIDLLPTLMEMCGLDDPGCNPFDGVSMAKILDGSEETLPERVHFLNILQSSEPPRKERGCVMTSRWRLVHGTELYDIQADPGQTRDVAADHPEIAGQLRAELDTWWGEVSPGFDEVCRIHLGSNAENPCRLTAMDVMGDVAWQQAHVIAAQKSTGTWNVDVRETGRYRVSLRRWPEELPIPIEGNVSAECARGIVYPDAKRVDMHPEKARLVLFGEEHIAPVAAGSEAAVFELDVTQTGPATLDAWFVLPGGDEQGAYYVVVERLGEL